jgi:S-methyl-1-thioxylulose 5-phosphate methylthiotransferase
MSVIHHFCGTESAWDWENVLEYPITPGDERSKGASGKVMISPKDGAHHFVFRYFRVEPGGFSTLKDKHAHDHGVIILHGRAIVHIGENHYEAGPHDVVYISPWEEHWLEAVGDEAMGFLCVIPNKEMMKKLEAVE